MALLYSYTEHPYIHTALDRLPNQLCAMILEVADHQVNAHVKIRQGGFVPKTNDDAVDQFVSNVGTMFGVQNYKDRKRKELSIAIAEILCEQFEVKEYSNVPGVILEKFHAQLDTEDLWFVTSISGTINFEASVKGYYGKLTALVDDYVRRRSHLLLMAPFPELIRNSDI